MTTPITATRRTPFRINMTMARTATFTPTMMNMIMIIPVTTMRTIPATT